MSGVDPADEQAALKRIQRLAANGAYRLSLHARKEMLDEAISTPELFEAIANGQIVENCPFHIRGACGLLHGVTAAGRNLHTVCTTTGPELVIITVYVSQPPKWPTPTQRRR